MGCFFGYVCVLRRAARPAAVLSLLLLPVLAHGQLSYDMTSVEALIHEHKTTASILLARSAVEQANEVLHEAAKAASVEYDSLNIDLDRYSRCFDVIDVIYSSGTTIFNAYNTYDDVKTSLKGLREMLTAFVEDYTLHGNVMSSDAVIIEALQGLVSGVRDESHEVVKSLVALGGYASGVMPCRTEEILLHLAALDESLEGIRLTVEHACYYIWRYLRLRTYYHKPQVLRTHSYDDMLQGAFRRWRQASRQAVSGE